MASVTEACRGRSEIGMRRGRRLAHQTKVEGVSELYLGLSTRRDADLRGSWLATTGLEPNLAYPEGKPGPMHARQGPARAACAPRRSMLALIYSRLIDRSTGRPFKRSRGPHILMAGTPHSLAGLCRMSGDPHAHHELAIGEYPAPVPCKHATTVVQRWYVFRASDQ